MGSGRLAVGHVLDDGHPGPNEPAGGEPSHEGGTRGQTPGELPHESVAGLQGRERDRLRRGSTGGRGGGGGRRSRGRGAGPREDEVEQPPDPYDEETDSSHPGGEGRWAPGAPPRLPAGRAPRVARRAGE